jgi:quercetin dioxygenase-like cupin family protein
MSLLARIYQSDNMMLKHVDEVEKEEVDMDGVEGTYIQWIYSKKEGTPDFSMRRFTIKPKGKIPLHDHPWEHEIYILEGSGKIFTEDEEVDVKPGNALYVPVNEPHGYENDGDYDLVFLCLIPNKGDKR